MPKPVIFWFRSNLRLQDNPALEAAISTGLPIIPVYILDDRWLEPDVNGFSRTGELRLEFLYNTIKSLEESLRVQGGYLFFYAGNPVKILNEIYTSTGATAIYAQQEFASYERQDERNLSFTTKLLLFNGGMLVPPPLAPFSPEKAPFYYTAFKNKVWAIANAASPLPIVEIKQFERNLPNKIHELACELPAAGKKNSFAFSEADALKRLNYYLDSGEIFRYSETRDMLDDKNLTSNFSPWLANGVLSPRTVMARINKLKIADEAGLKSVQTFKEQLIWRDYFRYLVMRYGVNLFHVKGLRASPHAMHNDVATFEKWRTGQTGEPIIDALMRELLHTGNMSNRGRMLVSFFLAKVLKVNWTWGAAWFEHALLDYDVYCNFGNWAYQAGRGTDSRVNRRFNLEKQASKFDPQGNYRKKWLAAGNSDIQNLLNPKNI